MEGRQMFIVRIYPKDTTDTMFKNAANVTVAPTGKVIVKKNFFMIHEEGDCKGHEKLEIYFDSIIKEIRNCEICKDKKIEIYRTV